ncbi:hypothetical protein [Pedobacter endophyticus]|uniref:Uncharacterized protein n=1 Tax=Pedobacter endophyticus TaxID=2789740 RepID=A0A7S9PZR8_9SPHI|nr:hypothetical protein [Pedobacter endophyticus]QPH40833.1 hypothetical protein IZT61_06085 [Pedobacter endophyticus]
MTQHSNHKSKTPKGKPSGTERGGNGLKEVTRDDEVNEALEREYLDDEGQPDENVNMRHENRNTDKGRRDQGEDTTLI